MWIWTCKGKWTGLVCTLAWRTCTCSAQGNCTQLWQLMHKKCSPWLFLHIVCKHLNDSWFMHVCMLLSYFFFFYRELNSCIYVQLCPSTKQRRRAFPKQNNKCGGGGEPTFFLFIIFFSLFWMFCFWCIHLMFDLFFFLAAVHEVGHEHFRSCDHFFPCQYMLLCLKQITLQTCRAHICFTSSLIGVNM